VVSVATEAVVASVIVDVEASLAVATEVAVEVVSAVEEIADVVASAEVVEVVSVEAVAEATDYYRSNYFIPVLIFNIHNF
jgi:hypothetical protein